MKSLLWVPGASSITDSNTNQPPWFFIKPIMSQDFPFDVPEFPRVPESDHWLFIFGRHPFGCISSMTDLVFIYWVNIHEIKTVETPSSCIVDVLSNWVVTEVHSSKSDLLMISSYLNIPPISQSPCLIISFQTCNQNEYFFQKFYGPLEMPSLWLSHLMVRDFEHFLSSVRINLPWNDFMIL